MTNRNYDITESVTADGSMTFGELKNGQRTAVFTCCEDVQVEPLRSNCKVQMEEDGNMHITELPKRIRKKPLLRGDNCSLSLGRDGKYYFIFSLPKEYVCELPEQLERQSGAIAQKVRIIYNRKLNIKNY